MSEITGFNMRNNCVGVIGGLLGQMIICFQGVYKGWKKEVGATLLSPKLLQNFLFLYVEQKMRCEKLVI